MACLTIVQTEDENDEDERIRNILCNIARDCMVTNAGTFYVWALLTIIFRCPTLSNIYLYTTVT